MTTAWLSFLGCALAGISVALRSCAAYTALLAAIRPIQNHVKEIASTFPSDWPAISALIVPAKENVESHVNSVPTLSLTFGPYFAPDIVASLERVQGDIRSHLYLGIALFLQGGWYPLLALSRSAGSSLYVHLATVCALTNLVIVACLALSLRKRSLSNSRIRRHVLSYILSLKEIQQGNLLPGDEIVEINGIPTYELPAEQINTLMTNPSKDGITLAVRRNKGSRNEEFLVRLKINMK